MKYQIKGNYFQNEFVLPPTSGLESVDTVINLFSPANTDHHLWTTPIDYRHIAPVIDSAKKGFSRWKIIKIEERIQYLNRFQKFLEQRRNELKEAIALETGFPTWEVDIDITDALKKISLTIEHSLPRIKGVSLERDKASSQVNHYPVGPCVVITPFNKNLVLLCEHISSILLAGNSIIIKPSERLCYSSQIIFECLHESDLPSGTVNLIQGGDELARRLCREKGLRRIFFTGSKETGKEILMNTSDDLAKQVILSLSTKNCTILNQDANLDRALISLVKSSFISSGQRCSSSSIVPIHRSIMDNFITSFHEITKRIVIDHPIQHQKTPFMGPLIDQKALDHYLLFVGMAKRNGFEEIMRGKAIEKQSPGYYASPSICLAQEFDLNSHFLTTELLAPNCTFIPFDDIDEAIKISNQLEFGLVTSVFTNDPNVQSKCLAELETGTINFNISTLYSNPHLPLTGLKNSGNNHSWGVASINSCVYTQSSNLNQNKEESPLIGLMKESP